MSRRARLVWNAPAVAAALAAVVERNINDALAHLEATAKKKMARGNASGRSPSAPGEYPKRVTGELGNAVAFQPARREGNKIRGRFGVRGDSPAGPYAKRQELGFTGKVSVPAHRRNSLGFGGTQVKGYSYEVAYASRPFIRPTVRSELKTLGAIMRRIPRSRGGLGGKAGS